MKVNLKHTLLDAIDAAPAGDVALIDDRETVVYGDLRHRAGRIASWLRRQHGSGGYLIVRATPDADFVATLIGVMFSGNTPIPIAPDTPTEELDYIYGKSRATAVLSQLTPELYEEESPCDRRNETRPAIVLFTSGTTGRPKGVIISHDNLQHSCATISDYLDYYTHASAAVALPLHYSYALLSQVMCQLYVNGRVRIFAGLRNPIKIAREVGRLGLETFCGVPSTYHALTEFHRMSSVEMKSVRVICSAGAAMNHARLSEIREVFPQAAFFNNYGMTEAAPRIAYIRDDDPLFDQPTCGRAMAGVDLKVVDPQTHEELPEGETGVLAVAGPNVTSGYLNDPGRTAEAFTADGYLLSNDMARIVDGYIYLSGRFDDIFNVAGEKVSPLEVERVLNQVHGVARSGVTGVPDAMRGMAPIAFLQLDEPLTRRKIIDAVKDKLAAAKVPQRFFSVRSFPTTPNGKLRRKDLDPNDAKYVIREIN